MSSFAMNDLALPVASSVSLKHAEKERQKSGKKRKPSYII
ncbi:hypothetical protein GCHA_1959 [Paraglaciecola chathamensis S18K6]|uniref:Uncharacterized protein n=2 Tax=Paraglaciecola chathamensis TaxID=368405 RepID=A0ABQ0I7Q8_9ALTE|nr:hypothetical protein GAGA_2426 [Paraglaciecola agarilytica NO2]GAC09910.1 hypothetical protein GCHA_1959 [Paraglaciecola chathamensis S18K6]